MRQNRYSIDSSPAKRVPKHSPSLPCLWHLTGFYESEDVRAEWEVRSALLSIAWLHRFLPPHHADCVQRAVARANNLQYAGSVVTSIERCTFTVAGENMSSRDYEHQN